jgi:hypothetical protein
VAAEGETRACPYCKEEIKADAVRCKHCRSTLAPEQPRHEGTCPYCKESIHAEAVKCKHCGSAVGPMAAHAGCEGCGESPAPAAMSDLRRTRGGGPGAGSSRECYTKYILCRMTCGLRHPDDPMMFDACLDSCDASYRLCTSFGGGGGGGGPVIA